MSVGKCQSELFLYKETQISMDPIQISMDPLNSRRNALYCFILRRLLQETMATKKLRKYTNKLNIVIDQMFRYMDHPRALLTELFIAFALTNSDSYGRHGTCCPLKMLRLHFPLFEPILHNIDTDGG